MKSRIRRKSDRQGAVSVEMAVTLPVLFLVVFASIEFSRMNVIRHTASNAAYEGARAAIVPGGTATDAENIARSLMGTCGAREVNVQVVPATINENTPEVEVIVTIDCDSNGLIASQFFRGKQFIGRSRLEREAL